MSSLAPINSMASVVNFIVTLKYIEQGKYLLGCGREWNSGGRDVSSMPLRIFRFDTNGSRCLKEYKELGCSNSFPLFLDLLVISAVPSYIAPSLKAAMRGFDAKRHSVEKYTSTALLTYREQC